MQFLVFFGLLQNDHLNLSLTRHRIFFKGFISVKGVKVFQIFIFNPILMLFFFFFLFPLILLDNNLSVIYQRISPISYDFREKLNQMGTTNAEFHNLNLILMQFLCKVIIFMCYWWTYKNKSTLFWRGVRCIMFCPGWRFIINIFRKE